jgi:glutathione S-transferase
MKLHHHPASTTSRIVMLFAAESRIAYQPVVVDLFTGEHFGERYVAINPNRQVPVLEDGDFRLTECSAILKYLAESIGSPAYPEELRRRARINERMDWFNTQFCRDFAYGFVYPQIFPTHKREKSYAQDATLDWHRGRARSWLEVLDRHIIGPRNGYVCGDAITLADYMGAPLVALGELARNDFSPNPNVRRWLGNMNSLASWRQVFSTIDGYAASIAGNHFVSLEAPEPKADR